MHSVYSQGQGGEALRFTAASILIDHRLLQMWTSFNNNPVLVINDALFRCYVYTHSMVVYNYICIYIFFVDFIAVSYWLFYEFVLILDPRDAAVKYVLISTTADVWSSQSYFLIYVSFFSC